jgi:hypothetical protein
MDLLIRVNSYITLSYTLFNYLTLFKFVIYINLLQHRKIPTRRA